MVVGTPVDDGLLDLFLVEILGNGAGGECGDFGVGGKAEGDELLHMQGVDEAQLRFGQEVGEAELLFKADDAVLGADCRVARDNRHSDEDDRHDNPPKIGVVVGTGVIPAVNRDVDGEEQVQEKKWQHEKGKQGIAARVVGKGLGLRHRW
jgi:hypothetical protein